MKKHRSNRLISLSKNYAAAYPFGRPQPANRSLGLNVLVDKNVFEKGDAMLYASGSSYYVPAPVPR
jgi:hypothetical protein